MGTDTMLRLKGNQLWAFDAEWVPDPVAGRRLYGLAEAVTDREVIDRMWQEGGATREKPQPYLKTALCRIVSISAVVRKSKEHGETTLDLFTLPREGEKSSEREIITRFLSGIGERKAQLVGFNSLQADILILFQRAIIHGLTSIESMIRPAKAWEGEDYFDSKSGWHIDLFEILGGRFKGAPSLHEIATLSGIPGKLDTNGDDVVHLWLEGEIDRIVAYNECDAVTTYLLFLRVAGLTGVFSEEQLRLEEERCRRLVERLSKSREHFRRYLERWEELV